MQYVIWSSITDAVCDLGLVSLMQYVIWSSILTFQVSQSPTLGLDDSEVSLSSSTLTKLAQITPDRILHRYLQLYTWPKSSSCSCVFGTAQSKGVGARQGGPWCIGAIANAIDICFCPAEPSCLGYVITSNALQPVYSIN